MKDQGFRMKDPAHPGSFVREITTELGLNVTEAAKVLGVTRMALSNLLNEHAALSPEMAIRVEKAFGVSMETLMRMQTSFDVAQARQLEGDIAVKPYVAKPKSESQPNLL
jgi:addiction module HigA family antidote